MGGELQGRPLKDRNGGGAQLKSVQLTTVKGLQRRVTCFLSKDWAPERGKASPWRTVNTLPSTRTSAFQGTRSSTRFAEGCAGHRMLCRHDVYCILFLANQCAGPSRTMSE